MNMYQKKDKKLAKGTELMDNMTNFLKFFNFKNVIKSFKNF